MRLIDADAVREAILKSNYVDVDLVVDDFIDKAPTIEDRPTGYWESLGFVDMKYAWFRCSNCHKTTKIYKDSSNDFCCITDIRNKAVACLYCGSDMKGERR